MKIKEAIYLIWLKTRSNHRIPVHCCILEAASSEERGISTHMQISGRGYFVTLRSLSNSDLAGSKNAIWKCNIAFLQSFLNYSKSLRLQNMSQPLLWNYCGTSASEVRRQNWTFGIICSRLPRLRNFYKWEIHVQSVQNYCFSSTNMQIRGLLVAVVVVVA